MPAQTARTNTERFAEFFGDTIVEKPKGTFRYTSADGLKDVYPNADLTTAEYDAMFLGSDVHFDRLTNEAALMTTKWFDYRFMHFVESTYLFTRHYIDAYRRMYRKSIDHTGYRMGFTATNHDFLNGSKTVRTGFLIARQRADEHGIPYWFYCDFAMKWAVEDRIWNMPPKPNQLYSAELIADMILAWEDRCRWTLQAPIDERFLMSSGYEGKAKEEFQEWFCGQIMMRPNPERGLNSYMNIKPMISLENAIKYVGKDIVSKVV